MQDKRVSSKKKLTATDKTLVVLQEAVDNPRFTDIVNSTGLPKSSVHRILQCLVEYGYLSVSNVGMYYPGATLYSLASKAFERVDIASFSKPFMEELATATNCQVHLGALNWKEVIYIAVRETDLPYRIASRVGDIMPLHCTSMGKAMLAYSADNVVESYINDPGLNPKTPHTITSATQLREELDRIREYGYSVDNEENVPGIVCVAAPIINHLGRAEHGVSVTALAMDKTLEELKKYAPLVIDCASKISAQFGVERED